MLVLSRQRDESILIGPAIGRASVRDAMMLVLRADAQAHPAGLVAQNLDSIETNIAAIITVMVVDIRGDKVRQGVDAPKDMHVLRGELVRRDESYVPAGA